MMWLRFGLGRHEIVALEEDPMNIVYFYQTIFANEILYPFGLATARLSLVVLYHRIFGLFNARYYLHGLMAFIMAWAVYAVCSDFYSGVVVLPVHFPCSSRRKGSSMSR